MDAQRYCSGWWVVVCVIHEFFFLLRMVFEAKNCSSIVFVVWVENKEACVRCVE